jgi:hypothetical protein
MTTLEARDRVILKVVADGGGELGSRSVDIRVSQRQSPTAETIFDALKRLQAIGYLARRVEPGSPHDAWEITERGVQALMQD